MVTFSRTRRSEARTAIQTSLSCSALPGYFVCSGAWSWMLASGPLHRADHVRERDLLGRLGEPVAAAGAASRPHQPGVLQLEQDVLEELERDVLRLGELLALDGLVARGGHLDRGAHGVVGFCGDPHMLSRR